MIGVNVLTVNTSRLNNYLKLEKYWKNRINFRIFRHEKILKQRKLTTGIQSCKICQSIPKFSCVII